MPLLRRVPRGAVAQSLSVATEYGALTQSVSGQVVTIQGNAAGLPSALVRNNIFPYCVGNERYNHNYCVSSSLLSILRRLSFSASFDASRDTQTLSGMGAGSTTPAGGTTSSGAVQPVTFTGKKRELTSFSARLELWDTRDATSKKFQDAVGSKVGQSMDASSGALQTAGDALLKVTSEPWYVDWYGRSLALVRSAGRDRRKLGDALKEALMDFSTRATGVITPDVVRAAQQAYNRFFADQDDLIDSLAKSSVLAIEYTDSRPLGQAPVNNMRLIVDKSFSTQAKFVANGAVDFYGSVPQTAGLSRLRDVQAGVEIDYGILGGKSIVGPATLSGSAYYQYQHSAVLLNVDATSPLPGITFNGLPSNATTVFAQTGSIWLAQAKLSIVPGGKSTKIPISVTYSNRTELINKPDWRAQIGVSYDFDALMSLFAK